MKNSIKEKRIKARAEARPKKVMEILGWTITADERQYITKSEKEDHRYFSTLENALWHIAEQYEKGFFYKDLTDAIKQIKQVKVHFLDGLRKALVKQG